MLKDQLELLTKELNSLKEKITTKLAQKENTITNLTQQKNETANKLELSVKENSENEKVLEQLLKEFKELGETLNA